MPNAPMIGDFSNVYRTGQGRGERQEETMTPEGDRGNVLFKINRIEAGWEVHSVHNFRKLPLI